MEMMTREESYADRRLLFKNIWEAAMQIDEKDADIMAKPKVIKTLRLDEVDKYSIGKKKKERIRNLRTVCKKILDFCDRQDADDKFYEQKTEKKVTEDGDDHSQNKVDVTLKKVKKYHRRKKFKRAKSLFAPKKSSRHRGTTSERKDNYPSAFVNSSRNNSPIKTKRHTYPFVQRTSVTHKRALKANSSPDTGVSNSPVKGSVTRRKVVRKKRSKRKKATAQHLSLPGTSGIALTRPTRM